MRISEKVDLMRKRARDIGDYKFVSKKCGVSFHWLQKFACGSIKNPTIENIAKLEVYFDEVNGNEKKHECRVDILP
jgi:transcriptional regulator with XRE-family HTH domain